ncbi:MAG: DUF2934 domain-containing protein [Sedimentisphaerales bacterium]|nr:DUF2934 domain-containing protein [Sedimentisphaerales bacterium]
MPGKDVQKARGKGRRDDVPKSASPIASRSDSVGAVAQLIVEREPAAKPTPRESKPAATHEQIAERARAIWQQRGCPSGEDEKIWYEAEAQLKGKLGSK